jgi:hypothetical protein
MKSNTRSMIFALLAVGGMATTGFASAPRFGESDSTYQRELAVCGHNQQDRAACIREAGAARQAAARGGLTARPTTAPMRSLAAACSSRVTAPTAKPACWAARATPAPASKAA